MVVVVGVVVLVVDVAVVRFVAGQPMTPTFLLDHFPFVSASTG